MTTTPCTGCAVQQGTHQPAEALHKIAEPDAQHLQELAAYRFTVENLRARVAELEAQLAAAPQAVPASAIAGAVFDFAGYLTTRPHNEAIHCSEAHEASPMVEAITEWCKRRGLTTDGAKVETWRDHLAAAPAHPAEGVPEDGFELWWADHMPKSTQTEAWSAWVALHQSTHHTQQGLEQDAERYRMMRDRAEFLDNAKHCIFERDGWEIHGLLHGNDLDMVIDAALAAQAKQGAQA